MSDQDKLSIIEFLETKYEKKFKRFQILYGFARVVIILIGVFWMLERKGAEILTLPAQQKATVIKIDSGFRAHDVVHSKDDENFSSLSKSIDTLKGKYHYTR